MTHSGGKPHTNVGDRGQRYEVRYSRNDEQEILPPRVFGWAADLQGAEKMAAAWRLAPYVAVVWIVDRKAESVCALCKAPVEKWCPKRRMEGSICFREMREREEERRFGQPHHGH